jgi:hypothetical protein
MFKELLANRKNIANFAEVLFIFVLMLVINMLLIKFLWNGSLVKHISILKPITGFQDALLLAIALSVVRGL